MRIFLALPAKVHYTSSHGGGMAPPIEGAETMASKPYNGHASWNAWNVSLWINNEEPLYRLAQEAVRRYEGRPGGLAAASRYFSRQLGEAKTPDGARYSQRSIRAALEDIATD